MKKLFERVARTVFYTALLILTNVLTSFEVMIAFGIAVLIVSIDELIEK